MEGVRVALQENNTAPDLSGGVASNEAKGTYVRNLLSLKLKIDKPKRGCTEQPHSRIYFILVFWSFFLLAVSFGRSA
jgi:hypothetical protein